MISIKEITAYRTTDGILFHGKRDAVEHETNLALDAIVNEGHWQSPGPIRNWLKENAHELAPVLTEYARQVPRVEPET